MTTTRTHRPVEVDRTSPVNRAALLVGATFLLVGILGFVPGITSDFDQLEFAGHESGAQLLGLFEVSVLHNLVHIAFGVAGIVAARSWASVARNFLIIGGVVYLVLWLYGLLIDETSDANFVPVNDADNWLHFGLGVAMIALGALLPRTADRGATPAAGGDVPDRRTR